MDGHGAPGLSQALVFLLGGRPFGIDILQIQEIRGSDQPTPIPSAPAYFKGVTNLRGEFLPVIDLRVKLGISVPEAAAGGVTIILRVGDRRAGAVVDAVSEVIAIGPQDVKPMPATAHAPSAAFVQGLTTHAASTVVLLDLERLLDTDDIFAMAEVPA